MDAKNYIQQIKDNIPFFKEWASQTTSNQSFLKNMDNSFKAARKHAGRDDLSKGSFRATSLLCSTHTEKLEQIAASLAKEFANIFESIGYPLSGIPTVAMLPIGDLNAMALRAPNGDYICIMDDFLLGSLTGFSAALCEETFDIPPGEKRNTDSAILLFLGSSFMLSRTNIEYIDRLNSNFYRVNQAPMMLFACSQIYFGMLAFIFAHELAHHALHHTKTLTPYRMAHSGGHYDVTVVQRNHEQEFAADGLAFEVFLKYSREMIKGSRKMFSQSEIVPLLLFDIMAMHERQFCANSCYTLSTPSHPTATSRNERLKNKFMNDIHQNAKALYPHIKSTCNSLEKVITPMIRLAKEDDTLFCQVVSEMELSDNS